METEAGIGAWKRNGGAVLAGAGEIQRTQGMAARTVGASDALARELVGEVCERRTRTANDGRAFAPGGDGGWSATGAGTANPADLCGMDGTLRRMGGDGRRGDDD